MTMALQAGLWGLLSGSALLIGALVGWYAHLPQRLVAGIMAFGSGVLISALSFELMDEAWQRGGLGPAAGGFLAGALVYTGANYALAHRGARHRKRSGHAGHRHEQAAAHPDNGLALAMGALLDGIPESIVIGVSLLEGGVVGKVAVIAVFLSNLPEGLSSAAGMRKEGKGAAYTFGLWGAIALASGLAAMLGYISFAGVDPSAVSFVQAVAAGAILAMIVDTMVPEAFVETQDFAGLIAVLGFLVAFALSKLEG
jgi:ZIP family zinc transporter